MIPFPDKKYNIIYADPAWTFKTWSNKGEEKSPKYDVMTINDIKNLPIKKSRLMIILIYGHGFGINTYKNPILKKFQ